jgi:DNA polymerase-1
MTDKKTLLLVDGSSYLYRAFHAMPDLRAVPGDPASPATGAIRGMINMMQSLRKEVRADYAACVFDAKGPTFRDALYPEYKAQPRPHAGRPARQIAPIHEVVRLLGWTVLDVPGVEADDVIGTLAVTARSRAWRWSSPAATKTWPSWSTSTSPSSTP